MTKKALVVGAAGRMGPAVVFGLRRLGIEVDEIDEKHDLKHTAGYHTLREWMDNQTKDISDPDVIVSCAPYYANQEIATLCVKQGWRYCDMGGNPNESKKIMILFNDGKTGQCFTDLGLAPGLANIVAEEGCRQREGARSVFMRVGGLPISINNSLQYNLVFSPDGLYNEYTGKVKQISDGEVVEVDALCKSSDFEYLGTNSFPDLEKFPTKGGLAHSLKLMRSRGVKWLNYQTIRYLGHWDYINFMLNECKMTQKEFNRAIANTCPETKFDLVIMQILVDDWKWFRTIYADSTWTAMQKCTSFPTAVVASMMADGMMDTCGTVLDYSHVDYQEFEKRLKELM